VAERIVEIFVESSDEIPQDCMMRFQAVGPARVVRRVSYEPDDGPAGTWRVFVKRSDGTRGEASAVEVDDSGEGTSTLIYGGDTGIRLEREDTGEIIAEPYLLLAAGAILE
jgi:hypothetical protein